MPESLKFKAEIVFNIGNFPEKKPLVKWQAILDYLQKIVSLELDTESGAFIEIPALEGERRPPSIQSVSINWDTLALVSEPPKTFLVENNPFWMFQKIKEALPENTYEVLEALFAQDFIEKVMLKMQNPPNLH